MIYVFGALLPMLLQCLIILIVIAANTGNGSFVGLAAFLIGVFAVPATGIVNAFYIRANRDMPPIKLFVHDHLFALVVPIAVVVFLLVSECRFPSP